MKKIIDGKKYDTETAEFIGEADGGGNYKDFAYWREKLYKKKTGEFFLWGEGGPASKYAQEISYNEQSGGEKITPLLHGEAKEWAEQYLEVDDFEKIFGEVEE